MDYLVHKSDMDNLANKLKDAAVIAPKLTWPQDFIDAVDDIQPVLISATFTENGSYSVPAGYDGFGDVVVNITRAPRGVGTGIFYEAALNGQETVELEYYDPDTQEMYDVTIPNGLNVLQWETSAVIGS